MSFLKRLTGLFAAPAQTGAGASLWLTVRCDRCGEVLRAQVNLNNDLSEDYDEAANATTFVCRKVLIGSQRCFQPVEVTLWFDESRRLVEQQIAGGQFVDA